MELQRLFRSTAPGKAGGSPRIANSKMQDAPSQGSNSEFEVTRGFTKAETSEPKKSNQGLKYDKYDLLQSGTRKQDIPNNEPYILEPLGRLKS